MRPPAWLTRGWQAAALALSLLLFAHTAPAGPDRTPPPDAGGPGRRVALIIGNSAYTNVPALRNPAGDAAAVAQALRSLGFEVIERRDISFAAFQVALGEFIGRLRGAKVGLFFYAGHGVQVAGENYLVPVDAKLASTAYLDLEALPIQTVLRAMETEVPMRLVLLDACRDNPFARSLAGSVVASRSAEVGHGLARIDAAVGTLIAYATAPGEVAFEGEGNHSPFTTALLEH